MVQLHTRIDAEFTCNSSRNRVSTARATRPRHSHPAAFDESVYLGVMRQAIKAIRDVSPQRPILLDGLDFGRLPLTTLNDTSIIQAVHDYDPIQVTPYKAPWVDGSSDYHVLQPEFDRDFSFQLSADTSQLSIQITSGDWVQLSQVSVTFPASSELAPIRLVPAIQRWDVPQTSYTLDTLGGALLSGSPPAGYERDFKVTGWLDDWGALKQSGNEVMVGEFGVYNQTSQDVTLEWFQDQLSAFKQEGFMGWATWDPFSEFGVMGPPRPGETPENYAGYPLNRPMLDLLEQN